MKKFAIKKYSIALIAVILLLGGSLSLTTAYFTDNDTDEMTVSMGKIETEIVEEFVEDNGKIIKKPVVINKGTTPCYVRVRIVASPENAIKLKRETENAILNVKGFELQNKNNAEWKLGNDGYYYYSEALEPNHVTKAVITEVEVLDNSVKELEVTVYQEAIQTIGYKEDGTLKSMEEMWK
ncbi:MAG: SipW-dependent-type signal peptide-containing protein [Lachnospiraceae bacterium]|nr:SipW-dependent-type signal peptide-containing protein [Lachnospiraceae bacterium]